MSIYSEGKYVSKDADFLSATDHKTIKQAMLRAGFKNLGKDFYHWKDRQSLAQTLCLPSGRRIRCYPHIYSHHLAISASA